MLLSAVLTIEDISQIVGVPVVLLRKWLATGQIKLSLTSFAGTAWTVTGIGTDYRFTEDDIEPIRRYAEKHLHPKPKPTKTEQFVDDGVREIFTVAQIASMWQLSTDTIQKWFQDEPGVLSIGKQNPRNKRKRITLRIPREVMERVQRKRSR